MGLHDVDQLPTNPRNNYILTPFPTHLCTSTTQDDFTSYSQMVGGALLMSMDHYLAVGGYSNGYWGWGREDDDMFVRITQTFGKGRLGKLAHDVGNYRALHHPRVKGLDATSQFEQSGVYLSKLKRREIDVHQEGVRSVSFQVLDQTVDLPDFARYVIRLHSDFNLVQNEDQAVKELEAVQNVDTTGRGIHLVVLQSGDPNPPVLIDTVFDTYENAQAAKDLLAAVRENFQKGRILILGVQDEGSAKFTKPLRLQTQRALGLTKLTALRHRSSYCAIIHVGSGTVDEQVAAKHAGPVTCSSSQNLFPATITVSSAGGDAGSFFTYQAA